MTDIANQLKILLKETEREVRKIEAVNKFKQKVLQAQASMQFDHQHNFLVRLLYLPPKCRCGGDSGIDTKYCWLRHWRNGSRSQRSTCCVAGCCGNGDLLGALVELVEVAKPAGAAQPTEGGMFIAAICRTCYMQFRECDTTLWLNSNTTLVSVDTSKTCLLTTDITRWPRLHR